MNQGELAAAKAFFEQALEADPAHEATRAIVRKFEALGVEPEAPRALEEEVHHVGGEESRLAIRVLSDPAQPHRCGGLWASAPALVGWLVDEPARLETYVRGRRVLELGAGVGFVGIALRMLGAAEVRMTDLPQQLPLLRRNVEANLGDDGSVATAALPWGGAVDGGECCDLVVASDVTYDAALVPPLARTLSSALRAQPAASAAGALLAIPLRSDFEPPVLGGPDGRSVLPDWTMLTTMLASPDFGSFSAERVASLPGKPHAIDVVRVYKPCIC